MQKTPSITEKNSRPPAWARRALATFSSLNVMVLGDVMLDRFWFGDIPRISPEAPVPVFLRHEGKEDNRLGGAANTWSNLLSLGAKARLIGLVGQDDAGAVTQQIIGSQGGGANGLVASPHRPTTVKTRLMAMTQQVLRLDEESSSPLTKEELNWLKAAVTEAIQDADAVVVSDYAKGVLTPQVVAHLAKLAKERNVPVLVDPKPHNMPLFKGFTLLSPNVKEASLMSNINYQGALTEKLQQVMRMAEIIFKRYRPGHLVITLGADGIAWCEAGRPPVHQKALAREVYDVSGAGDTVHATLALGLALENRIGLSKTQILELANRAAAVAVGKLGTATVTAEEVSGTWG